MSRFKQKSTIVGLSALFAAGLSWFATGSVDSTQLVLALNSLGLIVVDA